MANSTLTCALCDESAELELVRRPQYRVILVDAPEHPGFCRVIWNQHVREMTDLRPPDRALLMDAVWRVEQCLREVMQPDKINLASLGNMAPHLHWHVIARYQDDAHFPHPVWSAPVRTTPAAQLAARRTQLEALQQAIRHAFV